MSNIFAGRALPLPDGMRRGSASFAPAAALATVRHALGYQAFVAFVGVERARQLSAETTLDEILIHARSIRDFPRDLERAAAIFLGNKIAEDLAGAEWRAYGATGLEIASGSLSYDVVGAVHSARDESKDPRPGLRRFLSMARGAELDS
jgi:hypothetical protein